MTTKTSEARDLEVGVGEAVHLPTTDIKVTVRPTATDVLTHLRETDREPLTIWKVKGPKLVGGEISAILCQDANEIVLAHTLPSGKWSLFAKVAK